MSRNIALEEVKVKFRKLHQLSCSSVAETTTERQAITPDTLISDHEPTFETQEVEGWRASDSDFEGQSDFDERGNPRPVFKITWRDEASNNPSKTVELERGCGYSGHGKRLKKEEEDTEADSSESENDEENVEDEMSKAESESEDEDLSDEMKTNDESDSKETTDDSAEFLSKILENIRTCGTFATAGIQTEFPLPDIRIGPEAYPLSFPLCKEGADKLKEVCEKTRLGLGDKTALHETCRKTWQAGPENFVIKNPHWKNFIVSLLPGIKLDIGIPNDHLIELDINQIMLHEEGSYFKTHNVGEKADRMIGTMIVVLPSIYEGGKLVVHRDGQQKVFDMAMDSVSNIQYVTLYADCEHEVKPVTKGNRVCLVYDILQKTSSAPAPAPNRDETIMQVSDAIKQWKKDKNKSHPFFYYVLLQRYSQDSLSFDMLKGADWSVAYALAEAARLNGCEVALATAEKSSLRSQRYEMCVSPGIEIAVKNLTLSDGKPAPITKIDAPNYQFFHPQERWCSVKYDKEEYVGDFDDACMEVIHWYNISVLVLWSKDLKS